MKLLELFCGTKSITKVFNRNGIETFTVDMEEEMNPDLCIDILDLTSGYILEHFGKPDIIWASPPCTKFSIASVSKHWTKLEDGTLLAKNKDAEIAKKIVLHTIKLIEELKPKYWFIENPRGMLRKMPFMQNLPRYTVTYCQYGDTRMKPTDIWSNHLSPGFKSMCKNGDNCHESAPRGSKTGTQGLKNARERGIIPEGLCEHIYKIIQ